MSRKYTSDKEREVHHEAVKLRKMTDKQLTSYVSESYRKGFEEGIVSTGNDISKLKEKLTSIKGVGPTMQARLVQVFEEI